MYYKKIGKLSNEVIDIFLDEIFKLKSPKKYQWIHTNQYILDIFLKIFPHNELKVQFNPTTKKYVQKVVYTEPNYGYRIHKDGLRCKSALNFVLNGNESDWIRWYDEKLINSISSYEVRSNPTNEVISRDTNIFEYENIPYVAELRTVPGDIYLINVDQFHSFKCNGPKNFITMQTKFENFPAIEDLCKLITENSFNMDMI